ncbi:hypothetical protein C1H46_025197 [Malus baccata]|uniref:Uncharacterized protein n=1 Tax=Malus baccata TaxID=106549 RepID=A0A540LS05_MALBA|nr:hypothetical protein C1H46_025197 [Malus baccata]
MVSGSSPELVRLTVHGKGNERDKGYWSLLSSTIPELGLAFQQFFVALAAERSEIVVQEVEFNSGRIMCFSSSTEKFVKLQGLERHYWFGYALCGSTFV